MTHLERIQQAIDYIEAHLSDELAIETIAVVGRHIGLPLLGAIEIIQAAILLASCSAMVSTTLTQGHASVHLLTDRLPPRQRVWLIRLGALISGGRRGLFLSEAAHEQSELMHIPFRPLRALAALSVVTIAAIFLFRALRPGSKQ